VAVPQIVTIPKKRGRKIAPPPAEADPVRSELSTSPAAKSSIVTVRKRGRRFADVPDMTPEEHRRVSDLADALWRDMVRRIKDQS
jgi:hypothetical protein